MRSLLGIVAVFVNSVALATDTLDCEAPPYYLRVTASAEFGAQHFSLGKEKMVLAEGNIKQWRCFELQWPNALSPSGNSLKLNGSFGSALEVSGIAEGNAGYLEIDGKKYNFKCDWKK